MRKCSDRILRLCAGRHLGLSFRPGRTGWLLTSPLKLSVLRGRLSPWVRRVTVLHQPSGRYFVQPDKRFLLRALEPIPIQSPAEFYDCPRRMERLRRLAVYLGHCSRGRDPRGQDIFMRLALRLEQADPGSGNLWKHMASDFDELWYRVPLFAMRLSPFQQGVLRRLCGVQCAEKGESTGNEGSAICFFDGTPGSR